MPPPQIKQTNKPKQKKNLQCAHSFFGLMSEKLLKKSTFRQLFEKKGEKTQNYYRALSQ